MADLDALLDRITLPESRPEWFGNILSHLNAHDPAMWDNVVFLCLYNYAISVAAADHRYVFMEVPYVQIVEVDGEPHPAWFAPAFDTGQVFQGDYANLFLDRAQRTFDGDN